MSACCCQENKQNDTANSGLLCVAQAVESTAGADAASRLAAEHGQHRQGHPYVTPALDDAEGCTCTRHLFDWRTRQVSRLPSCHSRVPNTRILRVCASQCTVRGPWHLFVNSHPCLVIGGCQCCSAPARLVHVYVDGHTRLLRRREPLGWNPLENLKSVYSARHEVKLMCTVRVSVRCGHQAPSGGALLWRIVR